MSYLGNLWLAEEYKDVFLGCLPEGLEFLFFCNSHI
jgi:hypothetical protein